MIPKKLHYCWLSQERMPEQMIRCMATWKEVMPEYELIKWDMNRFDITANTFVHEACSVKKWAFAADYIRLYALYTEGGIYLDCDVTVKKSLNDFLDNSFFSSLEYHWRGVRDNNTLSLLNEDGSSKNRNTRKPGIGMQAAVLGAVQGHPFLQDCLDWYRDKHFIQSDGSLFNVTLASDIFAMVAENYGFKYKHGRQTLQKGMLILPFDYFAANYQVTENTYAVHEGVGTWRKKTLKTYIKKMLGRK